MANVSYTSVRLNFENDKHPVLHEWMCYRLNERIDLINTSLKNHAVWTTPKSNRTIVIDFDTDYLNFGYIYANIVGYADYLCSEIESYVKVSIEQSNTHQRLCRFALTKDFGALVNTEAPIEIRRVGQPLCNQYLDDQGCPLYDIFVLGEPTAARKAVSWLRDLLTDGIHAKYNTNLKWIEANIKNITDQKVVVYVRTQADVWGNLIKQHDANTFDKDNTYVMQYINMCRDGKLKDFMGIQSLVENAADVYGVLELCLQSINFCNRITHEDIQSLMALVKDPE